MPPGTVVFLFNGLEIKPKNHVVEITDYSIVFQLWNWINSKVMFYESSIKVYKLLFNDLYHCKSNLSIINNLSVLYDNKLV